MFTRHILVLGGDLVDAQTLGPLTQSRVQTGVAYAKAHSETLLYAAAGVYSEFPDMREPMASLMAEEAQKHGVHITVIGPDQDFNTRGELRVFRDFVPAHEKKAVISAWWHLPRVRRIIAKEWGHEESVSWEYLPAPGKLGFRLAFLELLKWVLTFAPESVRSLLGNSYRALFGRSSW